MPGAELNPDRLYKKTINAWCMYDWANSAFATTIMAAVFPPFFRSLVQGAGLAGHQATAYWGYTTAIALLIIALTAPVLGAVSDYTGGKKRFVAFFAALGILSTSCLVFLDGDAWLWGAVLFIGGNLGFAGGNVFYESFLPHLARKNDIDQISTRGYAMGYIGGGLLLTVNILWVIMPEKFWMPDTGFAVKASFFSVAVWWALFSTPFFLYVPEPVVETGKKANPVKEGLARLKTTFRELARFRQALVFLVAFWIYSDGIGTIIKMAAAYGDEIGIGLTHLIGGLIVAQFTGIPFTFLFGALARKVGTKRCIMLTLVVYTIISILSYFMRTAVHFYVLAFLVGTVQGGSQALSRSLFGSMVPKHKAAEFFGFFTTSSKMAGIAGPLLFGLISHATAKSRLSILALIIFFIVGGLLISLVDEKKGYHAAREAEAEYLKASARTRE